MQPVVSEAAPACPRVSWILAFPCFVLYLSFVTH
jgi:hypothetical protein